MKTPRITAVRQAAFSKAAQSMNYQRPIQREGCQNCGHCQINKARRVTHYHCLWAEMPISPLGICKFYIRKAQ